MGEEGKPRKHVIESADQVRCSEKASKEDRFARSHLLSGGMDLQHVYKGCLMNLGEPDACSKDLSNPTVKLGHEGQVVRSSHSTVEATVMDVEGRG